jgi:hypothetical protein
VDILARTRTSEYAQFLSENKWSEQIQALQIIIDAIGAVPKIAPGDFTELMQTLKVTVHLHAKANSDRLPLRFARDSSITRTSS